MTQKKKCTKGKTLRKLEKLESEMVHFNFTNNIGIEKEVLIKREQLMERPVNEIISIILK